MIRAGVGAFALTLAIAAWAEDSKSFDPVAFFTGPTQGRGVLNELLGKEKRTTAQSVGKIDKDGWLILDQKVDVQGDALRQRHWRLKQVGPGKFSGTLSDAKGPVEVAVAGQSMRIRYTMKNGIKVDQSLTVLPGGKAVDNHTTFRKFGMKVATLIERIEKR